MNWAGRVPLRSGAKRQVICTWDPAPLFECGDIVRVQFTPEQKRYADQTGGLPSKYKSQSFTCNWTPSCASNVGGKGNKFETTTIIGLEAMIVERMIKFYVPDSLAHEGDPHAAAKWTSIEKKRSYFMAVSEVDQKRWGLMNYVRVDERYLRKVRTTSPEQMLTHANPLVRSLGRKAYEDELYMESAKAIIFSMD